MKRGVSLSAVSEVAKHKQSAVLSANNEISLRLLWYESYRSYSPSAAFNILSFSRDGVGEFIALVRLWSWLMRGKL